MTATPAKTCQRCGQAPTAPNFLENGWCWNCHCRSRQDRYPVIVEYTMRHVVWVGASDQDAAAEAIRDEPYEYTDDQETLCDAGWQVQAPKDAWDWGTVTDNSYSHAYQGTEANAHVEEHRRWRHVRDRMLLDAWVENEDRDIAAGRINPADRITCPICPAWWEPFHENTAFHINTAAMRARRAAAETARSTA